MKNRILLSRATAF